MERLTIKTKSGYERASIRTKNQQLIDKLAQYENLEQQGRMIIFPCNKGDKIYEFYSDYIINAQPTSQVLNLAMRKLLDKIAKYFKNDYTGNDSTAPKLEISVQDMRAIAAMNVDWCRLHSKEEAEKKLGELRSRREEIRRTKTEMNHEEEEGREK